MIGSGMAKGSKKTGRKRCPGGTSNIHIARPTAQIVLVLELFVAPGHAIFDDEDEELEAIGV
jgi:hypothetical protein